MSKRELLERALDALNLFYEYGYDREQCFATIEALKAESEKPEPETIAWMRPSEEGYDSAFRDNSTIVECPEGNWSGWLALVRKEDV